MFGSLKAVRSDVAAPDAGALRFEVIDDPAGFGRIKAAWQSLSDARGHYSYFQSFDYLLSAWERVAGPRARSLMLVVARRGDEVVLIWPLVGFSARHARWLGSEKTEYRDVLVAPVPEAGAWIETAWEFICRELGVDWVFLQDVRTGSIVDDFLELNGSGAHKITVPSRSLDCTAWDGWESFWASQNRKLRADQRRQWRRIAERGDAVFRRIDTQAEIRPMIDWMVDRKVEWLERTDIEERSFGSPENRAFILATAEKAFTTDNLYLAALEVNSRPVAVLYGLLYRSELTFICFSYDNDFETYSPSRLAMAKMIEWAFETGVRCVDFMPGILKYKLTWTDTETTVSDWLVPCNRRGRFIIEWYMSKTRRKLCDAFLRTGAYVPSAAVPSVVRSVVRRLLLLDAGQVRRD